MHSLQVSALVEMQRCWCILNIEKWVDSRWCCTVKMIDFEPCCWCIKKSKLKKQLCKAYPCAMCLPSRHFLDTLQQKRQNILLREPLEHKPFLHWSWFEQKPALSSVLSHSTSSCLRSGGFVNFTLKQPWNLCVLHLDIDFTHGFFTMYYFSEYEFSPGSDKGHGCLPFKSSWLLAFRINVKVCPKQPVRAAVNGVRCRVESVKICIATWWCFYCWFDLVEVSFKLLLTMGFVSCHVALWASTTWCSRAHLETSRWIRASTSMNLQKLPWRVRINHCRCWTLPNVTNCLLPKPSTFASSCFMWPSETASSHPDFKHTVYLTSLLPEDLYQIPCATDYFCLVA